MSWLADSGFVGGTVFTTPDGTPIYQSETTPAPLEVLGAQRYGMSAYQVNMSAGRRTVRLHLIDTTWDSAGQRVFDVTVNGALYLQNLDLYALTGRTGEEVVYDIVVDHPGGDLIVGFAASVDNAIVAAIEVLDATGLTLSTPIDTGPPPGDPSVHAAGDWDQPGVEDAATGNPNVLWVATFSRSLPTATTTRSVTSATYQALYGPDTVVTGPNRDSYIVPITGKPWRAEMVARHLGDGELRGHERRHAFVADLEIPEMEEAYFRQFIEFKSGYKFLGDMKIPDLSGVTVGSGGYSSMKQAMSNYSLSTEVERNSFSGGMMLDNVGSQGSSTSKGQLKHYWSGPSMPGGTWGGARFSNVVNISLTNSSNLTFYAPCTLEIIVHIKLNTVGVSNGIGRIWVGVDGATPALRSEYTNLRWRNVTNCRINMLKDRIFWGGATIERPKSATNLTTSPHCRDWMIASAMPPARTP